MVGGSCLLVLSDVCELLVCSLVFSTGLEQCLVVLVSHGRGATTHPAFSWMAWLGVAPPLPKLAFLEGRGGNHGGGGYLPTLSFSWVCTQVFFK